jgi:PST family polysaccharide transporter
MRSRAVDGLIVTGISQAAKLPFQLATVTVLPRLLEPADFGVYAMALPILGVLVLLIDLGFTAAIIQNPELTRGKLAALFWINTGLALLFATLILAGAPAIAAFYKEPRVADLAPGVAAILIMTGVGNAPNALLMRRMQYGWLAFLDALAIAVGLIVGVCAALMGLHHWALLLDAAAQAFVSLIGWWLVAGWVPRERPDVRGAARLIRFGGGVMICDVATATVRNLDSILIGRFAGSAPLGFYDRANKLAIIPIERISTLLKRVLLPIFSRLNEEPERFRVAYLRVIRLIMLATLPGIAAAAVTAPVLIPFLMGEKWAPAAPMFSWLAVAALHYPVSLTMNWLFVSQGRAGAFLLWSAFNTATCALAFAAGLFLVGGALGVAIVYGLSELLVRLPFLWWCVARRGPIRQADLYRTAAPFAAATALSAALVALLQFVPFPSAFAQLAASAIAAYAAAGAVAWLFPVGRATFRDAQRLMGSETMRLLGLLTNGRRSALGPPTSEAVKN